ncbi:MAG: hypothetical protein HYY23_06310 [Verrucomicrobia bacterium]|nr:hypothetical protein [Verrucomicrobiota bacterium]
MTNRNSPNLPDPLRQLLDTPDLPGLGPQRRSGAWPLRQVEQQTGVWLGHSGLPQRAQDLIRGTLLLWHDHLGAAHTISQAIEDADGSLLHAIMHRREPDYGNSKYWFRRVGKHPCYPAIAASVGALLKPEHAKLAARVIPSGAWDPFAFVDMCEKAASGECAANILQEIQKLEIESFLAHVCVSK